jgi:hypothetical protein
MNRIVCSLMVLVGTAGFAAAGTVTPEISASSATGALALLSGAVLVLRGRRKSGE